MLRVKTYYFDDVAVAVAAAVGGVGIAVVDEIVVVGGIAVVGRIVVADAAAVGIVEVVDGCLERKTCHRCCYRESDIIGCSVVDC